MILASPAHAPRGIQVRFCLLVISQQSVLNKTCRECFFMHFLFLGLNFLGLWGKISFLGYLPKAPPPTIYMLGTSLLTNE